MENNVSGLNQSTEAYSKKDEETGLETEVEYSKEEIQELKNKKIQQELQISQMDFLEQLKKQDAYYEMKVERMIKDQKAKENANKERMQSYYQNMAEDLKSMLTLFKKDTSMHQSTQATIAWYMGQVAAIHIEE